VSTSPPGFYAAVRELFRSAGLDPGRRRRALLLSEVMRRFAALCGQENNADYWAAAGLLHHPDTPDTPFVPLEQLKHAGASPSFLRAIARTAPTVEADHFEILLVTLAHLTALIAAIAATRPRQSVKGLKVSAVQKKFLDPHFAPESSRRQIQEGVRALHWEIGDFTSKTLKAVLAAEDEVRNAVEKIA